MIIKGNETIDKKAKKYQENQPKKAEKTAKNTTKNRKKRSKRNIWYTITGNKSDYLI